MSLFHVSKVDQKGNILEAICTKCQRPMIRFKIENANEVQYSFTCPVCQVTAREYQVKPNKKDEERKTKEDLMRKTEQELQKALNIN